MHMGSGHKILLSKSAHCNACPAHMVQQSSHHEELPQEKICIDAIHISGFIPLAKDELNIIELIPSIAPDLQAPVSHDNNCSTQEFRLVLDEEAVNIIISGI